MTGPSLRLEIIVTEDEDEKHQNVEISAPDTAIPEDAPGDIEQRYLLARTHIAGVLARLAFVLMDPLMRSARQHKCCAGIEVRDYESPVDKPEKFGARPADRSGCGVATHGIFEPDMDGPVLVAFTVPRDQVQLWTRTARWLLAQLAP